MASIRHLGAHAQHDPGHAERINCLGIGMTRPALARALIAVLVMIAMSVFWTFMLVSGPMAAPSSPACLAGLATLESLDERGATPGVRLQEAVEEACGR